MAKSFFGWDVEDQDFTHLVATPAVRLGQYTLEARAKAQTVPVTPSMRPSPEFRMGSKQTARLGRQDRLIFIVL